MIYGDGELLDWWRKFSVLEKEELFERILETAENQSFLNKVAYMRKRDEDMLPLTPEQIAVLRKWAR